MARFSNALVYAIVLCPAFCLSPARAQDVDQEKIVACMIENTRPEDKEALRQMMIHALQDNQAEFKKSTMGFGMVLVRLAINECSMGEEAISTPAFQAVAGSYGEKLGGILMDEAFAKMK